MVRFISMAFLCVSSLGPSALTMSGAAASVKRKEASQGSAQPKEKKKKKSALDEIMEVPSVPCPSTLGPWRGGAVQTEGT